MPIKTPIDFAASQVRVVKKPTVKKRASAKKKPGALKKAGAVKSSLKKAPSKKVVSKKKVVKKSSSVSVLDTAKPLTFSAPAVAMIETETHNFNKPVEIQRKIILVGTCGNCDHMPIGVNKLVAVLSLAIAVLSGMLIYASSPMSFKMPSISMNTITDWVTPVSHVKNL